MITIRNTQKKILIDKDHILHTMQRILKKLEYEDYAISITIVNDEKMQDYNKTYRGKDAPTDILSFPFHANLKPGERIQPISPDEKDLGDIIIDAPYVARAAADRGISFDDHLKTLLVHGVYHLLGYDHITDEDYEVMRKEEESMLDFLSNANSI